MRHVDEELRDVARRAPERRVARSHHAEAVEQVQPAVHLQTKVSRIVGGGSLKDLDAPAWNVIGQLARGRGGPCAVNRVRVEGGEFPFDVFLESEVELGPYPVLVMAKDVKGHQPPFPSENSLQRNSPPLYPNCIPAAWLARTALQ